MRDSMGEGIGDKRRTSEGDGMENEGGTKTTRTDGEASNALVAYSELQRASDKRCRGVPSWAAVSIYGLRRRRTKGRTTGLSHSQWVNRGSEQPLM